MRRLAIVALLAAVAAVGCARKVEPPPPTTVSAAPAAATVPPAATPAPPEAVPGLPQYPGASVTSSAMSTEVEHGFGKRYKATLLSSDSFAQVTAFYRNWDFARDGWRLESSTLKAAKAEWTFSKEGMTSVAEIELEVERGGVEIKLERRDR